MSEESENPYESPVTEELQPKVAVDSRRVSLPGGFMTITGVAILAGLVIGYLLVNNAINPFVSPGICMFAACSLCVYLLRGLRMSTANRIGLTFILTLTSYVLFVPACIAGSFGFMALGFSEMYGPDELGMQLATLFSSVLVLNLIFAIALSRLN